MPFTVTLEAGLLNKSSCLAPALGVTKFIIVTDIMLVTCCAACCILSSIVRTFYMENDAQIFPAHYTWKVAEKGFKVACMMNKLAMINSCKITVKSIFLTKIIVKFRCALYLNAHYTR
jgi:hypothetical protein